MKKYFAVGRAFLLLFFVSLSLVSLGSTKANEWPALREGDLIFQTSLSAQSQAIHLATKSEYSHVGMVKIADGNILVVEAIGPVVETPLREWVKRGVDAKFAVYRMKGFDQAAAVLQAAEAYYGLPYDFSFSFDKEKIYCSELVYYAYKEGAGIELGKVQAINDLNLSSQAARVLIDKRWRGHPTCQRIGAKSLGQCKKALLQEKLITPIGLTFDPRLELIHDSF